jgi:serine/threonine protein kinase
MSGTCCDIFRAIYKGQSVVVKMLKKEFENDKIAQNELQLEYDILSRLNHKNIQTVQ